MTSIRKLAAGALVAFLLLGAALPAEEKRISVYSTVATYSLPVVDRAGHEYVGLLEVLEPLGRVSAGISDNRWKLRYNDVDSEFVAGGTRAKIRARDYSLPFPFLMENSRGLVPVSSLSTLLPRFLGNSATLHESGRRLFIGDTGVQVKAQIEGANPPRVVLSFSAPVNPTIATEPGKLRMVFTREPLVWAGNPAISFDNTTITAAAFAESNGTAELTIAGTAPLMANFSNGGRTITIAAAGTSAASPSTGAGGMQQAPPEASATGGSNQVPTVPRPIVVIDPAHGGSERGAALTDTLAEKNVTLGFARLLRHELEQQGFAVILLREGDDTATLDQRAEMANGAHAILYIGLHAASQGSGAHVYYAVIPPDGASKGSFRPWISAQVAALPVSQSVVGAMVGALQRHQIPARPFGASLRPLNNLLMPAVAVELAPGPSGIADLPSANYQQKAAAALADAVTSLRQRLGVQP